MQRDLKPEPWSEEEINLLKDYLTHLCRTEFEDAGESYQLLHKSKTSTQIDIKIDEIKQNVQVDNHAHLLNTFHLGEEKIMINGVRAKVIRYCSTASIDVEFEDGTVKEGTYLSFKNGKILHPGLYKTGTGNFVGYKTKYITTDSDNNYWYETEKNGIKDIMTPQMMLESSSTCR